MNRVLHCETYNNPERLLHIIYIKKWNYLAKTLYVKTQEILQELIYAALCVHRYDKASTRREGIKRNIVRMSSFCLAYGNIMQACYNFVCYVQSDKQSATNVLTGCKQGLKCVLTHFSLLEPSSLIGPFLLATCWSRNGSNRGPAQGDGGGLRS